MNGYQGYAAKGSSVFSTVISSVLLIAVLLGIFAVLNQGEGTVTYNYTKGLQFEEYTENGVDYVIIYGLESDAEELIIPREYEGKTVVEIADNAFKDNVNITRVYIPDGVKTVGENAFSGCTNLADVEFFDFGSLREIGDYAFNGCTSLKNVKLPNAVRTLGAYSFSDCTNLQSIDLNYGIEYIGVSAFRNCAMLEKAVIPCTVSGIGDSVFKGCDSVTVKADYIKQPAVWTSNWNPDARPVVWAEIYTDTAIGAEYRCVDGEYATLLTYYGASADVYIPESANGCPVTVIGDKAFPDISVLESLYIPKTVKRILFPDFRLAKNLNSINVQSLESWCNIAFAGPVLQENTTLFVDGTPVSSKLVIPDGIQTIPSYAFANQSISSVTISGSVKNIMGYAFENCDNLRKVSIPVGVEYIGGNAFAKCGSLKEVSISETVKQMELAFEGCPVESFTVDKNNSAYYVKNNCVIDRRSKTLIMGFKTSEIPDDGSVLHIANGAFYGCNGLEEIIIPEGVQTIGRAAFSFCRDLETVVIPASVTSIDVSAFAYIGTNCGGSEVTFEDRYNWNVVDLISDQWHTGYEERITPVSYSELLNSRNAGNLLSDIYQDREWRKIKE